jgi:hypothetical protein
MERAEESLDLVRCGGEGARGQFVEVAHADEYRSAGLKHETNLIGAVAATPSHAEWQPDGRESRRSAITTTFQKPSFGVTFCLKP